MGIIDALKPIHQAIYFTLWSLARFAWDFNRIGLTSTLWLNSLRLFVVEQAANIVELVADALVSPAGLFLTFAFIVYGLWRLAAIFFPTTTWKPVELPKAILYGLLMGVFFAAPAAAMTGLEAARAELRQSLEAAISNESPTITPAGYSSSEPGLTVYNLDGQAGASGVDLAGSLMGVSNLSELGSPELPASFQSHYFTHGTPADFTLDDDVARTAALTLAGEGLLVMFLAPVAIFYAFAESLLWLVLTAAAVILWLSLPIALMLAPFRASEGLFSVFFNRYIQLWIETVISAVMVAILSTILAGAAAEGFGLFLAAGLLAGFIVLWRVISAARLASSAVGTIGGPAVTGGVSLDKAAGTIATGTVAIAGGLVTGGATTAAVAAGGLMLAGSKLVGSQSESEPVTASADNVAHGQNRHGQGVPGARVAALGGFLLGQSNLARGALQTAQEMRLVSGLHQAEQPDRIDAAYIGSLFSQQGTNRAYLTLGMMDGPQQVYRRLGLAAGGRQRPSWGPDESGLDPAELDAPPGDPEPRPSPTIPYQDTPTRPRRSEGGLPSPADPPPVQVPRNQGEVLFSGRPAGVASWAGLVANPDQSSRSRAAFVQAAEQSVGPAARQVAAAIQMYGAPVVQQAATALADQLETDEQAGLEPATVLQRFRQGDGLQAVAARLPADSPLRSSPGSDRGNDLQAIVDMALAARRQVSREALIAALGAAVNHPDQSVSERLSLELGTPAGTGVGRYTGLARTIVLRARQGGLSGDRLASADQWLRQGRWQDAYATLRTSQLDDNNTSRLLADLAVLPVEGLELPQTIAFQPGDEVGYRRYQASLAAEEVSREES